MSSGSIAEQLKQLGYPQAVFATKDGQMGIIPQNQVDAAKGSGYEIGEPAVYVTNPQGGFGLVPRSQSQTALNKGYIIGLPSTAHTGDKGTLEKLWDKTWEALPPFKPEAMFNTAQHGGARSNINLSGRKPESATLPQMQAEATRPPTLNETPAEAVLRTGILGTGNSAVNAEGTMLFSPGAIATGGLGNIIRSAKTAPVVKQVASGVQRGSQIGFGAQGAKNVVESATGTGEMQNADLPTKLESGLIGASMVAGSTPGVVQTAREFPASVREGAKTAQAVGSDILVGAPQMRAAAANKLRESAKTQYERVINPTTRQNKNITSKVVPELLDRGVIATSPKGLAKKAGKNLESAGQAVNDVWDNLPPDTAAEAKPLIDGLSKYRENFQNRLPITEQEAGQIAVGKKKAPGVSVDVVPNEDGSVSYFKVVDIDGGAVKAINDLQQMIANHGDKVPATALRKVRDVLDSTVAKAGGYAGIPLAEGSAVEAMRELANLSREQIGNFDPNMKAANAEYSFWKDVERVAKATAERRVGQQGGLKKMIYGGAGAVIGGSAAGPHGTVAGLEAGKAISNVGSSALYNTTVAVAKNKLANMISAKRGNGSVQVSPAAPPTTLPSSRPGFLPPAPPPNPESGPVAAYPNPDVPPPTRPGFLPQAEAPKPSTSEASAVQKQGGKSGKKSLAKYTQTAEDLRSQGYPQEQIDYLLRHQTDRAAGFTDTSSWTAEKLASEGNKYPRLSQSQGSGKTTVYRAVPKGKGINEGDYVFLNEQEANAFRDEFGRKRGQPEIVKQTVSNDELIIPDAGSPNEAIFAPRTKSPSPSVQKEVGKSGPQKYASLFDTYEKLPPSGLGGAGNITRHGKLGTIKDFTANEELISKFGDVPVYVGNNLPSNVFASAGNGTIEINLNGHTIYKKLEVMRPNEFDGILAHELAHVEREKLGRKFDFSKPYPQRTHEVSANKYRDHISGKGKSKSK